MAVGREAWRAVCLGDIDERVGVERPETRAPTSEPRPAPRSKYPVAGWVSPVSCTRLFQEPAAASAATTAAMPAAATAACPAVSAVVVSTTGARHPGSAAPAGTYGSLMARAVKVADLAPVLLLVSLVT